MKTGRATTEGAVTNSTEPLWHVTLTVGGEPVETAMLRAALERLSEERPFLLSGRYGDERAELRYWEEAKDCADAAAMALRLWGEHRESAELPDWHVRGIEVVDRIVFQRRAGETGGPLMTPAGGWRPFTS
jgi:hypothetical protein